LNVWISLNEIRVKIVEHAVAVLFSMIMMLIVHEMLLKQLKLPKQPIDDYLFLCDSMIFLIWLWWSFIAKSIKGDTFEIQ
jgi:hypothetical protein